MTNIEINNSLKEVTEWFRKYRDKRPLPDEVADAAYSEMCDTLERRCKHGPDGVCTKDTRWIYDYAVAMMRQLTTAERTEE